MATWNFAEQVGSTEMHGGHQSQEENLVEHSSLVNAQLSLFFFF